MKSRNTLLVAILLGVLGIVLVLYFTLNSGGGGKRYQWNETYKAESDQPYGTDIIQKLLKSYRPGEQFIVNDKRSLYALLNDSTRTDTASSYVFIGLKLYLDEDDIDALHNFIYAGNDAFIVTTYLPEEVIRPIFPEECSSTIALTADRDTTTVTLNFYNTSLRTEKGYTYSYYVGNEMKPYYWGTLEPGLFCDSTRMLAPLGYSEPGMVNFFRLQHGAGNLYVHTNPIVFTNYFVIHPDKAEYASGVFSYMRGSTVIWDEYSRDEFGEDGRSRNGSGSQDGEASEVNPIAYILQQESLRYAWWIMLAGTILYAVFTARRKQRVIPVLEEKANTSLEFVTMVAALHFRNGNHHDIARKKVKYFFYFIRARYGIQAQSLTEPVMKRLSEKSKIDLLELRAIAARFNQLDNRMGYDVAWLRNLYLVLDNFYKNCN